MIPPSRVVVLTRHGCHLCDEAEAAAAAVCEDLGISWQRIDVDSHEALRQRFTAHVPVTFVDQRLLSYWFLDRDALRDALDGEPKLITGEWIVAQDAQP